MKYPASTYILNLMICSESIEWYTRAIETLKSDEKENMITAYSNLAQSLRENGNFSEALRYFRDAIDR